MSAGLLLLGYGAAKNAKNHDVILTLAEFHVKLIEEEVIYEGKLEVRYPRLDKRNGAMITGSYRWVEFTSPKIQRKYYITDSNARFKQVKDNIYEMKYIDSDKGIQFELIPYNRDNKWMIVRFQHAIVSKPIPNFLASNFARKRMFKAIYRKDYNKSSYKTLYKFPGIYVMPIKPLHQMMILAMQECENPESSAPNAHIFQKWWDKNKLEVLPTPFPKPNELHKCLKDSTIIFDYYC